VDGPDVVPLPPEQRGRIGRFLADDEGVPEEGRFMDTPRAGEIWGGAVGLTKAIVGGIITPLGDNAETRRPREEEETGMELQEPGSGGVTSRQADGEASGEAAASAAEPAPLAADGVRTEGGRPRPFFREEPADSFDQSPGEMLQSFMQLNKEIASFLFPIHLFVGGNDKKAATTAAAAPAAATEPTEAPHKRD